jgi:hypothetical protein
MDVDGAYAKTNYNACVDGAYAKNPLYDGTIIILVAKIGNRSGIPLAIAHVPIKSCDHLVWLLLLWGGLSLVFQQRKSPFCCQSSVFTVWVAIINKVLGLEHIIRNVTAKFGLKRTELPKLRSLVQECQVSQTIAHFDFAIEKVFLFPPPSSEPLLGYKMELYLLSIHSIHWTVFGNCVSLPKSTWFVAYKQLILHCLLKLGMVCEDDDDKLKLLIVESQVDCAAHPSLCTSLVRITMLKEWLLHSERLVSVIFHLQQQPINSPGISR